MTDNETASRKRKKKEKGTCLCINTTRDLDANNKRKTKHILMGFCFFLQLCGQEFPVRRLRFQCYAGYTARRHFGRFRRDRSAPVGQHALFARLSICLPDAGLPRSSLLSAAEISLVVLLQHPRIKTIVQL